MAQADDVRASIKVCMFDQYGTVVDMQTGLTEIAAPFLAAKGWQGDPNSFLITHKSQPVSAAGKALELFGHWPSKGVAS